MPHFPCITVWQPWASLIAVGAKPYEFRSWAAPRDVRGRRIAIHSAVRPPRADEIRDLIAELKGGGPQPSRLSADLALPLLAEALVVPAALPTSSVLCTALLGEPMPATELDPAAQRGMWAWPLSEIERIEPPIAARGKQGFWWVRLPRAPSGVVA